MSSLICDWSGYQRVVQDACIKLRTYDFHEPLFDRSIREKVNPDLTFDQRINCIIILLSVRIAPHSLYQMTC